jgi:hypothetical protein
MIKDRLKEFKTLLQTSLSTKSIKINKNGKIEIVFRFKPNIIKTQDEINILEKKAIEKIKQITKLKYRIISVQKQPSFSYNVYARLLSSSSSLSKDKVKRYLAYFEKNELNKFVKTSFAEIHFILIPSSAEEFQQFLINEN